jgi:cell division protein FtsZ
VQSRPQPVAEPAPKATPEAAGDFVAPRGPRTGQPSPETLARLQAAIHKAPGRQAAPQGEEKSRFGINSLINRMTGEPKAQHTPPAQAAAPAPRQQPGFRAQEAARAPEPEHDPDQERIEIPAFLRRQAN